MGKVAADNRPTVESDGCLTMPAAIPNTPETKTAGRVITSVQAKFRSGRHRGLGRLASRDERGRAYRESPVLSNGRLHYERLFRIPTTWGGDWWVA